MILVRLFQIAEKRDRVKEVPRPIAIFLDELKYHLSKAALEGLGAARDKGVHIIMAHQSIADLRDCPADLNGDAVVGAVVENAKFKLVYKLQDPETAEWVARMSGIILVDDESRKIETSAVFTESVSGERTIRMAERYYVDTNMLQNLPPFVCYVFTKELTKPSLISPLIVKKEVLKLSISEKDTVENNEFISVEKSQITFDEENKESRKSEIFSDEELELDTEKEDGDIEFEEDEINFYEDDEK